MEPPSTQVSVPLTDSSPIHIDLDIEDDEEIAAVPPEEVSKDTTVSWLENSLGRVRRRPSYQVSVDDLDNIYQEPPKKKAKKQVHFDKNSDNEIVVETAVPPEDKNRDEVNMDDFVMVKANLGRNTRHADLSLFKVVSENLHERVLKDGEDKAALKAENQQLKLFISNLARGSSQTIQLLPQVLETPADHHQLRQLVICGKETQEWIESFIVRGKEILAQMFQLRENAHELRQGIQGFEQTLAEVKPRHEIIIADLDAAYGSAVSREHKRQILAWRERHVFKVKTYERISEEFIVYRQRVVEALLFISEFVI